MASLIKERIVKIYKTDSTFFKRLITCNIRGWWYHRF